MEDEWRMNGESMELERFHKHIKEEDVNKERAKHSRPTFELVKASIKY